MEQFTIQPNGYLRQSIRGFYHSEYIGGTGRWSQPGTIENIICTLKNDITPYPINVLQNTAQQLTEILNNDLPRISSIINRTNLTVCVIPRAKVNYNANQLIFKTTVSEVVNRLQGFNNGTNYILRTIDTKTTHLKWGISGGGAGRLPYPGITNETCTISDDVRGKHILLIDDLYTNSVNIDEDAIQALLSKGANSVVFYAVGNTVKRTNEPPAQVIRTIPDNDDLPF